MPRLYMIFAPNEQWNGIFLIVWICMDKYQLCLLPMEKKNKNRIIILI